MMETNQSNNANNLFKWSNFLNSRYMIGIHPKCRFIAFEGPARSGKTVDAIQIFYRRVFNSTETYHLVGGNSLDTINHNILNADKVGLMVTHKNVKMVKDKIGGYYLSLIGADGKEKIILLAGYANESRWKSILGGTIECVFLDEFNIANKTFVEETFARQLSTKTPLTIVSTNGDDPNHFIYQEYINYCQIVGKCPESTREQMESFQKDNGKKDGYYYCFFPMAANPIMTPEKLRRAMSIYPFGSYYYITKILGERGVQGNLLFNDYMSEKLLVDAFSEERVKKYRYFTIGIDIGANSAENVFVLTGWNYDYTDATIIDVLNFQKCGYATKTEELKKWLNEILGFVDSERARAFKRLGVSKYNCNAIYLDCAEQNYITDLNELIYSLYGIAVWGSNKETIKERIDMITIGFSTYRITFDKVGGKVAYDSYMRAKKGTKQNQLREDLNEPLNDIMDATEYSLTPHMYYLMQGGYN